MTSCWSSDSSSATSGRVASEPRLASAVRTDARWRAERFASPMALIKYSTAAGPVACRSDIARCRFDGDSEPSRLIKFSIRFGCARPFCSAAIIWSASCFASGASDLSAAILTNMPTPKRSANWRNCLLLSLASRIFFNRPLANSGSPSSAISWAARASSSGVSGVGFQNRLCRFARLLRLFGGFIGFGGDTHRGNKNKHKNCR